MPCPDPQARRDRADGPSAGPQGRRRCGSDRSSGRDVDLSSEVFAGPQPDRAGLQQTQSASAQGGRAYDPAALASDRSRRYRFQPARMQELLSPCRLCSYMTGIRSNINEGTGPSAAILNQFVTELDHCIVRYCEVSRGCKNAAGLFFKGATSWSARTSFCEGW